MAARTCQAMCHFEGRRVGGVQGFRSAGGVQGYCSAGIQTLP